MKLFSKQENRIRCGRCGTEFDLAKNKDSCPLCGFGKKSFAESPLEFSKKEETPKTQASVEFFGIPPELTLQRGKVTTHRETQTWGSWLMFNDFFAQKFISRVLAWKMHKEKKDFVFLSDLMEETIGLIAKHHLSQLKGFPNLDKDRKGGRLVYHFLRTFVNMGLIDASVDEKKGDEIWSENWTKIKISLTKQGLEFARIKNSVFDEGKKEQILSLEEKNWLVDCLKSIDKEGYKEYSILRQVYDFLKSGKNGNKDLWKWFEDNKKFCDYIHERSERAQKDPKIFKQQIHNYARTFASAKISLLRELGVVKNKRNDYTIVGDLR